MLATILVTYASRYGSTAEVAQVVANTLHEHGLDVDLQPLHEIESLESYGSVILGTPLYIGRWPKEVHNFLLHHHNALKQRPVAIFTLGPIHSDVGEWEDTRIQLEKELTECSWLKPVAVELFGGKYDPATLRFPDNLLAKLPVSPLYKMPASDARDWESIRAWAMSLVGKFNQAAPSLTSTLPWSSV